MPDRKAGLSPGAFLAILSLPYLATSLNHNGFLALLPFVLEEFTLSRAQVGLYSSMYFISSGLLAIASGYVVDLVGTKKSSSSGVLTMGLVMFLYGFAPSYTVLLFLSFITGLGWSIITPSATKSVFLNVPRERRTVSMGVMQSGLGVGGLLGAMLLPLLSESLGWRGAIQVSSTFVIFTGLIFLCAYREKKDPGKTKSKKDDPGAKKKQSLLQSLLVVVRNKPLFRTSVMALLFGFSAGAALSHYAVYLAGDLRLSPFLAGLGLGTFQVGGIVGRPVWGWFSDRFIRRRHGMTLLIIGLFIGISYGIVGLFFNEPLSGLAGLLAASFFLGFCAFGWQGVLLVAVTEQAKEHYAGIATGVTLLFSRTGLLIAPPVVGFIADQAGSYGASWLFLSLTVILASFLFYHQHRKNRIAAEREGAG